MAQGVQYADLGLTAYDMGDVGVRTRRVLSSEAGRAPQRAGRVLLGHRRLEEVGLLRLVRLAEA